MKKYLNHDPLPPLTVTWIEDVVNSLRYKYQVGNARRAVLTRRLLTRRRYVLVVYDMFGDTCRFCLETSRRLYVRWLRLSNDNGVQNERISPRYFPSYN